MKNKNKQFETSDFYISAYLLSQGVKLLTINRTNPRRLLFVFEDVKDRQKMVEDFLLNKGLVEPKRYATTIKELKGLIYSAL
jgi:hypothetical protein